MSVIPNNGHSKGRPLLQQIHQSKSVQSSIGKFGELVHSIIGGSL